MGWDQASKLPWAGEPRKFVGLLIFFSLPSFSHPHPISLSVSVSVSLCHTHTHTHTHFMSFCFNIFFVCIVEFSVSHSEWWNMTNKSSQVYTCSVSADLASTSKILEKSSDWPALGQLLQLGPIICYILLRLWYSPNNEYVVDGERAVHWNMCKRWVLNK